jgi:hypothetical protein
MTALSKRARARQLRRIFCLLLLVVTLGAALHFHFDSGIKAERHCSVCVAMHAALPTFATATLSTELASSEYLRNEQPCRVSRLLVCGLYVRPPPVSSI